MLLDGGLKGQIFSLLSRQFPLRAGEIQKDLNAECKTTVTRQAVHKALNQLVLGGALRKSGQLYQVHTDFIVQMGRQLEQLRRNYLSKSRPGFAVARHARRTFTVNCLLEQDALWNSIISEKIESYPAGRHPYVQHVPHAWFALSHMEAEIRVTDLILQHCRGFYTLINGAAPLDHWIARFYQGKNSYYCTRAAALAKEYDHQYAVIGAYVLETRYPRALAVRLEEIFSSALNLSQLNLQDLIALVNQPALLKVTLRNDESLAEKLGGRVLAEFKR
jgi:hypothetical protein